MKKTLVFVFFLLLSISLVGCTGAQLKQGGEPRNQAPETLNNDEAAVNSIAQNFGKKLQLVSLLGPGEVLEKSMQENYGEFVSPALLEQWLENPASAPGRLTSSPWPDHIEIISTEKISEKLFEVKGEIIEIANLGNNEIAAKRPINLAVEKIDGKWLINNAIIGEYEDAGPVIFKNYQYGLIFSLPSSWKDYKIVTEEWEGISFTNSNEGKLAEIGPMISIRHPKWTSEDKRQDIPIMIFTLDQWESLEQGEFHIGAAPMGPKELARNSKYVFALPARYNYAFPTGYEEVEKILEGNPLQANENIDM